MDFTDLSKKIVIEHRESARYPDGRWGFSPAEAYPEYPFGELSGEENPVYGMVRQGFYELGLDADRFGTKDWNPLGELIRPGETVLLKPNLVSHRNPAGGLDCLVTHPSVLRAVIDYALIALQGTGKLTVADAPVQSCDFDRLYEEGGYRQLMEFYRAKGIGIEFADLRGTKSRRDERGLLIQEPNEEQQAHAVLVDLGAESAFEECPEERLQKLRITNYAPGDLSAHHQKGKHEYLISDAVLNADVVINLPKPKTHRKAGVTGALKNIVGINTEKSCLPHHTYGGKDSGGDEYPENLLYSRLQSRFHEKIDIAGKQKHYTRVRVLKFGLRCVTGFGKLTGLQKRHPIGEGSWSGNDTIWRTVSDLNRILLYADAKGQLHPEPQRKLFTVADMIVCGEGEGPLMPSPRPMGVLLFGADSADLDRAIAGFWGIDWRKIPTIANGKNGGRYPLPSSDPALLSNSPQYSAQKLSELDHRNFPHVKMPSGWSDV